LTLTPPFRKAVSKAGSVRLQPVRRLYRSTFFPSVGSSSTARGSFPTPGNQSIIDSRMIRPADCDRVGG